MKRFVLVFAFTCTLVAPSAWAAQDVVNTRHNLSTVPPVGVTRTFASSTVDEVCVFCHTPHNALPDAQLWNHAPTLETNYVLYGSTTMAATPIQPTGKSRLCLACHDGTVALGALNNPPAGNDMAATMLTGRAHLSIDLSDDHPISFDYTAAVPGELANPAAIDLPLEGTQLQCTTCHDPHEKDLAPFLHKTTVNGELCTTCHVRSAASWDWATSSHATSTAATPASVWPERRPEWPGATVAENSCLSCHDPHTAATPPRLITKVEENTCYACHDGTVAATDMQVEFLKPARHPVDITPNPDHDATKAENVLTMQLHAECMDCHNPHAVEAADPMISFNPNDLLAPHATAPAANAMIQGVTGLDLNGNPVTEITYQYELCFKCHGRLGQGPCGGAPSTRCSTADGRQMVRADGVYNIRDKVNGGNPALVSWHPIESNNPANNSEIPSLDFTTDPNPQPPINASTTLIYCTDCHSGNTSAAGGGAGPNGPHGSTNQFLLANEYNTVPELNYVNIDYRLCFKCHSEEQLIVNVASGFSHDRHVDGRNKSCVNCHDPHGSTVSGRLINFLISSDGAAYEITAEDAGGVRWVDNGLYQGSCYLGCHGTRHNPRSY